MRAAFLGSLALVGGLGCGPPNAVTVTLSSASFATSGGNLFNCTNPAYPPTPRSLHGPTFQCTLAKGQGGSYDATPTTLTWQLGCGDGHGAFLTVTCQGSGQAGHPELSGSVSLAIAGDCSTPGTPPPDAQTFAFQGLVAGAPQNTTLTSCADFDNACTPTDACPFNKLSANVQVQSDAP